MIIQNCDRCNADSVILFVQFRGYSHYISHYRILDLPGKPNHAAISSVQLSLVLAVNMFVGTLIRHKVAKFNLKTATKYKTFTSL